MELEQQVCSLELAKKLKELGVKQESLWYWNMITKEFKDYEGKSPIIACEIYSNSRLWENFSAFTVAELGEMLPKKNITIPR